MEKQNSKKKKIAWQQYMGVVFFMLIGAVCGLLMVKYVDETAQAGKTIAEEFLSLCGMFVIMYVAIFAQMIIHEAGHLVFGLLSGYQFSSFRIMSFMWVKENGQMKLRRIPKEARDMFDLKPGSDILVLGDAKRGIAILPRELQSEYISRIFAEIDEEK